MTCPIIKKLSTEAAAQVDDPRFGQFQAAETASFERAEYLAWQALTVFAPMVLDEICKSLVPKHDTPADAADLYARLSSKVAKQAQDLRDLDTSDYETARRAANSAACVAENSLRSSAHVEDAIDYAKCAVNWVRCSHEEGRHSTDAETIASRAIEAILRAAGPWMSKPEASWIDAVVETLQGLVEIKESAK